MMECTLDPAVDCLVHLIRSNKCGRHRSTPCLNSHWGLAGWAPRSADMVPPLCHAGDLQLPPLRQPALAQTAAELQGAAMV